MKKIFALLLVMTMLFTGVAVFAEEQPAFGGSLNVGTFADPDTLNPIVGNDQAGSWILQLIYPSLYVLDEEGNKIPYCMEEPVYSEDGCDITVTLKSGLKWDDGTPFTTKDVDYTFTTLKETQAQWQGEQLLLAEWEIVDDLTMVFHLEKPAPGFLTTVGFWTRIVPAHIWGEMTTDEMMAYENTEPVGMGPFKLTKYERTQYYTLEAVEDFPLAPAGRAYLDQINFIVYADTNTMVLALQSGDIDLTVKEIPAMTARQLESDPNYTIMRNVSLGFEHICPNMKNPISGDLAVRTALAMTLDREQIAAFAFDGDAQPMYGPISPVYEQFQYGIEFPKMDIEGAKKVLADAGWVDTDGDGIVEKDGVKCSMKMMYASSVTEYNKVTTIVAENAKQAGIEIIPDPMEKALTSSHIYNHEDTEWQLYLGTWGILDDINTTLVTLYRSGANLNFGDWENAEADAAMDALTHEMDPAEIDRLMQIVETKMVEDIADMPLVVKMCSYAHNQKFAGFTIYPSTLRGVIDPQAVVQIYQVAE